MVKGRKQERGKGWRKRDSERYRENGEERKRERERKWGGKGKTIIQFEVREAIKSQAHNINLHNRFCYE